MKKIIAIAFITLVGFGMLGGSGIKPPVNQKAGGSGIKPPVFNNSMS